MEKKFQVDSRVIKAVRLLRNQKYCLKKESRNLKNNQSLLLDDDQTSTRLDSAEEPKTPSHVKPRTIIKADSPLKAISPTIEKITSIRITRPLQVTRVQEPVHQKFSGGGHRDEEPHAG